MGSSPSLATSLRSVRSTLIELIKMIKRILIGLLFFTLGGLASFTFFSRKNQAITTVQTPTLFSLDQAPINTIKGEIISLSGEVKWQSRMATEPGQLTKDISIQQGESLRTDKGANLTMKFSSAGVITILPESEIEVVQTLPVNLVFKQINGVVEYQANGNSLLSIKCINLLVNINNGILTIETDGETGEVVLSLKTGLATVAYNSPEFDSKVWEMNPGDKFVFDSNTKKGYFKSDL